MGFAGKLYCTNKSGLSISTIYIQRKYIPIIQPLDIGDIIKHSSKVITSLTSSPINSVNLSFCNLLQILTSAYQLLNVTQPCQFGDFWQSAPPDTSSQLSLTASSITLQNNFTLPFTNFPDPYVVMTPYLFQFSLFGMET